MIQQLQSFIHQLSIKTRAKGKEYFVDNRIKEIVVDNERISCQIQGSALNDYQAEVFLDGQEIVTKCSCPIQRNCKHVAALIFAHLDAQPPKREQKKVNFSEKIKEKNEDISHPAVKQWIEELSLSHIHAQEEYLEESTVVSPRTLLFVLDIINDHVSLSLQSVKMKKNGGYARSHQLEVNLQNLWNYSSIEAKKYFSDDDWNLIHLLQKNIKNFSYQGIFLNFSGSGMILKKLIDSGKCFFKENFDRPIAWGDSCQGQFEWKLKSETNEQKLELVIEKNKIIFKELDPLCYFDKIQYMIGYIEFKENQQLVKKLLQAPSIPLNEVKKVRSVLSKKSESLAKFAPVEIQETFIDVKPKPSLKLFIDEFVQQVMFWGAPISYDVIAAKLFFAYGDHLIPAASQSEKAEQQTMIVDKNGHLIRINRYLQVEKKYEKFLTQMDWQKNELSNSAKTFDFMLKPWKGNEKLLKQVIFVLETHVPRLKKEGWSIEIGPSFPIQEIHETDQLVLDTDEDVIGYNNDWFDVKLGVMIDGERINLLPLLKQLAGKTEQQEIDSNETLSVVTAKGKLVKLPKKRLFELTQHLLLEFDYQENKDLNKLKISKWNAGFLAEFLQGESAAKNRWMGSEKLKSFAEKIKESFIYEEIQPPQGLQCELRPYQKEGLNWLQFLSRCQLNGVLADDMGLGKTIQTLAHILFEKESGRMKLPVIIVAPTSLIPNWFNESSRFAPSLKVLILHGNDRRLHFGKIQDYDLILTTYPLLMRDKEFLVIQHFHLLILDEAQTVKNFKTQAYQVVQQIQANQRICLSGTPMENHLGELWSLFHLLLPGFLGDLKTFQTIYRKPIEKDGNISRREALAKRIKPFILRRTKQQVVLELPEKTEIIQKIELKDKQRDLYEAIRLRAQNKVMKEIEKKGLAASQIIVLDALLKLRQVCCDPRLLKTDDVKVNESAKLEWLMEVVPQMIGENRKILLFSQFTSMLALIAEALNEEKIPYTILTGETKDRSTPVNDFQAGKVPVMLISLKAGGVGLNLTAADTVIHYDPWWNPSVENQATDRAHRIGQKNAVFVYKLVITGSLEEKILDLQERKKGLIAAMLNNDAVIGKQFSMDDLNDIFKPLPQPI